MSGWPSFYTSLGPFRDLFRQGLPILTYHHIGPRPRGARMKGLYVPAALFDRQLGELRAAGFGTAGFDVVLQAGHTAERIALISLDDGSRRAFAHAMPLLARHGFRAIQFIVAGAVGMTNTWQTARGEVEEPLMDTAAIREWLAAGHEIGSHSLTHPWLTRVAEPEARREIADSRKLLEDLAGRAVAHFCYPYGDYNERIMDLVAEAGYRSACTVKPGLNTPDTPRLALRRFTARYRSRTLRNLVESARCRRGRVFS